jgi:hypothetical protein
MEDVSWRALAWMKLITTFPLERYEFSAAFHRM